MNRSNPFAPNDAMALGQQFWDAWTNFAQQQGQASKPAPTIPNWQDGMQFWSKLAGNPSHDTAHAVEQLSQHGQRMLQMMQTLATRLGSGQPLEPGEFGEQWKTMLGGDNPMLDSLRNLAGDGARGWEQFSTGIDPLLASLRGERDAMLGMPAFGMGRERQQHLQAIMQAYAEYQETSAAYAALLAKASQDGLKRFEDKLAERSEPGRQIDSMRGLYDLWIDAAEEAYAEQALSPDFRAAYGAMVNAQMRLKQGLQRELDQKVGAMGLPTRAELDGAHRKIHQLQRELREIRDMLRQSRKPASSAESAAAKPASAAPASAKPAVARTTAAKSAARKPATKAGTNKRETAAAAAPRKSTPRKPAAKRAAKES